MKLTPEQFINKWGVDGLMDILSTRTSGHIARGNTYADVSELLEYLKQ